MKLPAGFPWFDPPHVQKVTGRERGDFFVPTKGIDEEMSSKDTLIENAKVGRILKTVGVVLAVAAFAALVIWAILDPGPAPKLIP